MRSSSLETILLVASHVVSDAMSGLPNTESKGRDSIKCLLFKSAWILAVHPKPVFF